MTTTTLRCVALFTCLIASLAACSKAPSPSVAGDDASASGAAVADSAAPAAPLDQPTADVPPATADDLASPAATAGGALERMDGYGDLRFGMSTDDAKKAWGGELSGTPAEAGGCYFLSPKWVKTTSELGFMIEGDRFVRYGTTLAKGTAPGGGKVGMAAGAIKALYGARLTAMPHKYVEGGQYLTVTDDTGGTGKLVFESGKDGVVTAWRVGVPPQVDYVEGCS